MKVDIWSDVVCPWCYVGKRRFEAAAEAFVHGGELDVVWHSFELDPNSPHEHQGEYAIRLARKYGMTIDQATAANDRMTRVGAEEGLDFRFEQARSGNTFDAHRLLHLAHDRGLQDAVKERLMRSYFTEGELVSDHDTLVRVVAEAGIDADEARAVLASDAYTDAVRADEETASEIGISGVPFFVIDGKFAVSGAQPVDVILSVLERAWDKAHPATLQVMAGGTSADGTCDDGFCAI